MTNSKQNPWAGLASYEDPSKSERQLKFCGRDNDIYDVTRLIDDNLLLVLYGKSGIGKTSLLNAGVFPKLRLEQYLPVSLLLAAFGTAASRKVACRLLHENDTALSALNLYWRMGVDILNFRIVELLPMHPLCFLDKLRCRFAMVWHKLQVLSLLLDAF